MDTTPTGLSVSVNRNPRTGSTARPTKKIVLRPTPRFIAQPTAAATPIITSCAAMMHALMAVTSAFGCFTAST